LVEGFWNLVKGFVDKGFVDLVEGFDCEGFCGYN